MLLWLVLPLNLVVGVLLIGNDFGGPDKALFAALLDIVISLLWIWLLLAFKHHPGRFLQSATALLGSGVLVGLLALPLQMMAGDGTEPGLPAHLAGVALFFVLLWSLMVVAHILRHALEVRMGLAMGLALTYSILTTVIVRSLFPESS